MNEKSKPLTLGEIEFDPPNHPFAVDVLRDASSRDGDTLTCIRCGVDYERGDWDFYSLCHACFPLFNHQKMEGRWGVVLEGEYYEGAEEWVEANPVEAKE